jgi:DNA-binding CsgD family transcriptional regulator
MGVLGVWDLDDTAEAVYRAVLRSPDLASIDLADRLQLPAEVVTAVLSDLSRLGLVTVSPAGVQAIPPASSLGALLQGEVRTLEERRARLDAVRADLPAFSADHLIGQTRNWSSVPFEVLSEDEASAAFEELQRGTEGEVLTCHAVDQLDLAPLGYQELVREQLAAGRPMRAVYPAIVVEDPVKLQYVRHWAAAGEQIRLLPFSAREIDVFGNQAALVSSQWEGHTGSMILVHAPAMIAILRELFERYWERAVPFTPVPTAGRADLRSRLLELLMMGAKDETIARTLGVSLRTVRRRVADLMDEMGATTRFQAGMEAVRRGLL